MGPFKRQATSPLALWQRREGETETEDRTLFSLYCLSVCVWVYAHIAAYNLAIGQGHLKHPCGLHKMGGVVRGVAYSGKSALAACEKLTTMGWLAGRQTTFPFTKLLKPASVFSGK